jgi:hypothetical protein
MDSLGANECRLIKPMRSSAFPLLNDWNHRETSNATSRYNCIAWAAGDTGRWWEPDADGQYYWPPTAPREYTVSAFIAAYESIGYERCDDNGHEKGFEKVAIYANEGRPTHAARQLANGAWTSKLGEHIDIEHELGGIEGKAYGYVIAYLKRRRPK